MITSIIYLGKPVILEMNFKNTPDEEIAIGQWIVLYKEIPVRKIGPHIYEVYPDGQVLIIEEFEDKLPKLMCDLQEAERYIDRMPPDYYAPKKYVRTAKGSKRVRPWESPLYF